MPCLYVSECEFRGRAVIKFGVSKYDDPEPRRHAHAQSRDNPFYGRLTPRVVLSIPVPTVRMARRVELQIRRAALATLPRAPLFGAVERLSIAGGLGEVRRERPSGEWLLAPLHPKRGTAPAVEAFCVFVVDVLTEVAA